MTDGEAAFEAWEADEWERQDRFRDRVRVLGYTIVACDDVTKAQAELEKAVTALERAKRRAERALAARDFSLEHAELVARCAQAGDAAWNEEVATCLERWLG